MRYVARATKPRITRRRLIAGAAGFGAGVMILPGVTAGLRGQREAEALWWAAATVAATCWRASCAWRKVVALCDVNQQRPPKTFQKAPDVPKHLDYRKMLEENSRHIDAALVATNDHHHFACAALAMKLGNQCTVKSR